MGWKCKDVIIEDSVKIGRGHHIQISQFDLCQRTYAPIIISSRICYIKYGIFFLNTLIDAVLANMRFFHKIEHPDYVSVR